MGVTRVDCQVADCKLRLGAKAVWQSHVVQNANAVAGERNVGRQDT